MGYIYKITNQSNQKSYIGQTKHNPKKRWSQHKYYATKGVKYKSALYNAIQKYGIELFIFEVIDEVNDSLLNEMEIYYITLYDTYSNGYNNTSGGQGNRGHKRIKKFENIIPDLYLELNSTQKVADFLNISRITVRTILKEKNLFKYNKKTSFDYKQKQVCQYTLDGVLLNIFDSITDACKSIGLSNKNASEISKCCKEKRNTAYGYKWKYNNRSKDTLYAT